jgi:hypothetical protein
LMLVYIDWRTDRQRLKAGITETHPYPVWLRNNKLFED